MIPVGDAFLNTCMNFTRSKPATTDGVDDSEYKQQASEVHLGGGGEKHGHTTQGATSILPCKRVIIVFIHVNQPTGQVNQRVLKCTCGEEDCTHTHTHTHTQTHTHTHTHFLHVRNLEPKKVGFHQFFKLYNESNI